MMKCFGYLRANFDVLCQNYYWHAIVVHENIKKIFHAQQLYASSNFDTVHQNLLVCSQNISSSRTGIISDSQIFDDPNVLISNMSAEHEFLPVQN